MTKRRRPVEVRVLSGEPTDGSGRVCIHLFVKDDAGPFVEPCVLAVLDGQLVSKPTRGRLACSPTRTVAPFNTATTTVVTPRTDDPRAVTCPKCVASEIYRQRSALLQVPTQPTP